MGYFPGVCVWDTSHAMGHAAFLLISVLGERNCNSASMCSLHIHPNTVYVCVCCFKWLKGLVLKTHQHEIDRWGHGSQAGRWLIANKGIDVHAQTKGPVSLEVIAKRKVKHQQHTERKILQSKDLHYFSEALQ